VTIVQITERWLLRCEHVLVYAGVVAMVAMMCLTSADALSRYRLNSPILGAYELTEKYLMVASIFLGLSYAYRGGMFIRVTFLIDRLPPALKLAVNVVVQLITLAFCLHAGGEHAAGDPRMAGRNHAQRAADPGRTGLHLRSARLPGAVADAADRPAESSHRPILSVPRRDPAGMTATRVEPR
jgi:hypothetical protein